MRPTSTPSVIVIGSHVTPPHSAEMSRFCNFVLPFLFSGSSFSLQVAILERLGRLMAQTTCFVSYRCLLWVWSIQIPLSVGLRAKKKTNFDPFFDCRFAAEIASALEPSATNTPLFVNKTPQKLDFQSEVPNKEFLSHTGGLTGSVLSRMDAAAILDFEQLLPFLYDWINPHQIWR